MVTSQDGKNWSTSKIPGLKGHVIEGVSLFFSDLQNGILVVDADRQMGYHNTLLYVTRDGGSNWNNVPAVEGISGAPYGASISPAGDLFLSYNRLNSSAASPSFYRSGDNGKTWSEITLFVPSNLKGIYNTVCAPTFDGRRGTLYITGGEGILAQYASSDGGLHWQFVKEDSALNFSVSG